YLVRTLNQFNSLDELGQVIVYRDAQTLVRLFEVAIITDAYKERSDITRIGSQESIELAIYKEGDANTVAVAKKLRDELVKINKDPQQNKLEVIYDQSEFIESAVSEVTSSALMGSVLAMLVIYLFLRNIIPTLIISISIPFSVIATFNMMYFADISLNIMSLGGIALAIGLLVDNAIVVLENIDRCRSEGMSKLDAAVTGTKEVAGAIFASTMTTLAVFVPLVFVDGIAGALFSDQALTVTFALLASLLVALTSIPMLASREGFKILPELMKKTPKEKPTTKLGKLKHYSATVFSFPIVLLFNYLPSALLTFVLIIGRFFSWLLGLIMRPLSSGFNFVYHSIESIYHKLLAIALRKQLATMLFTLGITGACISLLPRLGMELIPPMNQGEFYVEILLPPGTAVGETDRILQLLALSIKDRPEVKHAYSQAGSGGLMTSDTARGGENWGRLQVELVDHSAYHQVTQILRDTAQRIPALEAKIEQPELFSFKTPLEIELTGYDLTLLKRSADSLVSALS
ncbi:MAG: efflux RND transporter permease subunit, partial [Shewanella sp.]